MINMEEMKCIKRIEKKKNVLGAVLFGIRCKLNYSYADIDGKMGYGRGQTDKLENRNSSTFKNKAAKEQFYEIINQLNLNSQDYVKFEEIDNVFFNTCGAKNKKHLVLNVVPDDTPEEDVFVFDDEKYLKSELKELLSEKEYEYMEQRFVYNKTATEASVIFGGKPTTANKYFFLIRQRMAEAREKAIEKKKVESFDFTVSLKECIDTYVGLKYKEAKNKQFKAFLYCVTSLIDMSFVDVAKKIGITKMNFNDFLNSSNLKNNQNYNKLYEVIEKEIYPAISKIEPGLTWDEFKGFFE